jgi:hypothetical protein
MMYGVPIVLQGVAITILGLAILNTRLDQRKMLKREKARLESAYVVGNSIGGQQYSQAMEDLKEFRKAHPYI